MLFSTWLHPGRLHMSSWRAMAACAGLDTAIFYAETDDDAKGVHNNPRTVGAKAVCAGCSVREPCLEFALATGQKYGVWGGTTYQERRAMRRRQRAG